MQPYTRRGLNTQTQIYTDVATGASSSTQTLQTAWTRSLSCGPMVKGNFTVPNPWNYVWSDNGALIGTELVAQPTYTLANVGVIGPSYVIHPDMAAAADLALAKALARLNEKTRGSTDLSVSIAEAGQTVKMLNLVERYTSAVTHMRRTFLSSIWRNHFANKRRRRLGRDLRNWQAGIKHRFGKAYKPTRITPGLVSRVSKRGADGWLEFTYGWKPLVDDIRGVATNVVGHTHNFMRKFEASATQSVSEKGRVDGPSGHRGFGSASGFARCRYGIQMVPGFDEGLSRWTSFQPFSVAYELIPYSFVFDWIIDLGGYMRNLETSLLYRSNFRGGYLSILRKYRSDTVFGSTLKSGQGTNRLTANSSYSTASFVRVRLSSYPCPQPPKLNVDLGSSRLLSAASLLRQQLRRV